MNIAKALLPTIFVLFFQYHGYGATASNDTFADATELIGQTASDVEVNSTATTELGEPASSGFKTLWWKYRPASNGRLTVTTTGSGNFNKILSIYLGTNLPSLRLIANSNEGTCCSTPLAVVVGLPVIAQTEYLISVGNSLASSTGGSIALGLSLDTQADVAALNTAFAATMANDFFVNRVRLTGVAVGAVGYNVSASNEASAAEPNDSGSKTLWWSYRTIAAGRLTITTTGSDGFGKNLAVFLGTNFANLRLVASATDGACCNLPIASINGLPVTADTDYQVSLGSASPNSSGGSVVIAFSLNTQTDVSNLYLPVKAAAENDNFANRMLLVGGTVSAIGYNPGASREPLEPTDPNSQQRTIWWSWTAPAAGQALIDLTGSDSGTKTVSVWRGTVLSRLTQVAVSPATGRPNLKFTATAGENYQIAVGSPDARNAGNTVLSISGPPGEPGSTLAQVSAGRAIHLRWFATSGLKYQVQASSDDTAWTNVGSVITGNGSFKEFFEPTSLDARFYRVFVQP